MAKQTRTFKLYQNLWKADHTGFHETVNEAIEIAPEMILIDEICFKADLCDSYEQYIKTLCDGMILLLEAGISRRYFEEHPVVKEKILSMGDKILDNSYRGSDQLYIGLFVKLRVKFDWLQAKFYKIVQNMMHHVLDHGLKISDNIKIKIKEQLQSRNYSLYKSLFITQHKLQAL